ncbi:MAG: ABC transporter ATP-binding protein [Planctomycetota bacterium]|nr:ABC transporter ATP-binding protein [Planctomycetota bacterium]
MLLLEDVRKSYPQPTGGSVPILDIPKLEIRAGEQMVLRGDSGSGKTTLLQIISGITRADSGKVLFDGTDLTKLSESARDRFRAVKMGYVFQTFNLLPAFTALENVRLGMTFGRGKYRLDRAKSLLSQVGLDDRMHYRPSMLSVGQQQRVAVARALANQPRLLLADEPTANVDPSNQQKIIDLLKEVCSKESTALLMVTHSDSISQQFDRVEYLDKINTVLTSEVRS